MREAAGAVPIDGMIAAAATMAPNTTYGASRKSGEAFSRDHRILVEELADAAVGLQHARGAAVLQPGAAQVHPAERRGARRDASAIPANGSTSPRIHSTSASSTTSVTKLYSR